MSYALKDRRFLHAEFHNDGVFDQLDIVAALQTRNYLQGPYEAQAVDTMFGGE